MPDPQILRISEDRIKLFGGDAEARLTGVYVRALDLNEKWGSFDVAFLDKESLDTWVQSRGEVSVWAMGFIHILLGYEQDD